MFKNILGSILLSIVAFPYDVAISSKVRGKGVGTFMVNTLLLNAHRLGFTQINLVAVQGASRFWSRFGFEAKNEVPLCSRYGVGAVLMCAKI
ncbi:GNAT family N-acetyltransferase [Celerinatantimonas yamalensis]|uniref:GNAT family N-acetyltransferase n=1 Tax=Celerinatantimonas yamalensis TaxID=559956 RepID=A0ABW9G3U9_9GAMM